jgi:hypothetical protein
MDYLERAPTATPGLTASALDRTLGVGPQVVFRLLEELCRGGFVRKSGDAFCLSDSGRTLINQDEGSEIRQERQSYYFLAGPPPIFLPLNRVETLSWVAGPDWAFDVQTLNSCMNQSPDWKRRHGFPLEAGRLVQDAGAGSDDSVSWGQVVLDYPERLPAVLTIVDGDDSDTRVLGFAVRPENWSLQGNDPAFVVQDWRESFPGMAEDPSSEQWERAWRNWCQPRSLPEAQTTTCALEHEGSRLRVHASARLVDRLHAARSDALRGEAWILAGDGPMFKAALLDIVASKQEKTAGPL